MTLLCVTVPGKRGRRGRSLSHSVSQLDGTDDRLTEQDKKNLSTPKEKSQGRCTGGSIMGLGNPIEYLLFIQ